MAVDENKIEELAQQIYADMAAEGKKSHRQGIVPWGEVGETYRVSLRRMAQERLEDQK